LGEQSVHAAPFAPHIVVKMPFWQTPCTSQQPVQVLAHPLASPPSRPPSPLPLLLPVLLSSPAPLASSPLSAPTLVSLALVLSDSASSPGLVLLPLASSPLPELLPPPPAAVSEVEASMGSAYAPEHCEPASTSPPARTRCTARLMGAGQ
jgi:hypothetical protein